MGLALLDHGVCGAPRPLDAWPDVFTGMTVGNCLDIDLWLLRTPVWLFTWPCFSPGFLRLSGEIVPPSDAFDRDVRVQALPNTDDGNWKGQLTVTWMDVQRSPVEQRTIPFELRVRGAVYADLAAPSRCIRLIVHPSRRPHERHEGPTRGTREISFIARPPDRTWWDYQIIMWQSTPPSSTPRSRRRQRLAAVH